MPELPEVEVIRRGLIPLVSGKTLDEAGTPNPGSVRYPSPSEFRDMVGNRRIEGISRKGKYLRFLLDGPFFLVIHLGMTGTLIYDAGNRIPQKHTRVYFRFKGGGALFFDDQRKFGKVWLLSPGEEYRAGLDRLGPDWWNDADLERFKAGLARRGGSRIKPLLLDQHFMAGLGNIYVDESLFRAGIHPHRRVSGLSGGEQERIFKNIKAALGEGILYGGTSTRDYRDARGDRGRFQYRLAVYGRRGGKCRSCEQEIKRIVVCGRGTYLCPCCQQG